MFFDPLEVKHSQNGGPYASQTSMGWVVNGPLGRHHKGPLEFLYQGRP